MSNGNVADDVRGLISGSEGFYENVRIGGSSTGPWPPEGEAEHVFVGIEARAAKFSWFTNNERQTAPGAAIQLVYETIPADDSEPVTWRGSILNMPGNLKAVLPQLPEGKRTQLEIDMGRMRAALGFILEHTSINLLGDIDAANAMIAEDVEVLLTVRVADASYTLTRGPNAGNEVKQFIDYVNGAVISRPVNSV